MLRPLLIAASLAVASTASASLLTHEPFDYAAGQSLDPSGGTPLAGGTGWNEGWDIQNFTATYATADATPLTQGQVASSAGYAVGGGAFTNGGRRIATGFNSVWDQAGYVSDPFGADPTPWRRANIDRNTVWASMLLRKDANNNDSSTVALHPSGIAWSPSDTPRVEVGFLGGGSPRFWGLRLNSGAGNVDTLTSEPVTIGETAFLVLKLDLEADTLEYYVNPPAGAAPGTPDLTTALPANYGFKSIQWYPGNGSGNGSIDELRIGTTYADVAPLVPEPASGMVVLAGAALLLRRRA